MSHDFTDEELAAVEVDKPQRKPQKPPSPEVILTIARALSRKPAWWAGRPFPRDRAERREFLRLMRKADKTAKKAGREMRGGG